MSALLAMTIACILQAQTPEEARSQVEAHKAEVARQGAIFVDRRRSEDERLAAAGKIQLLLDPEQLDAALAIVRDAAQPSPIRAAALRLLQPLIPANVTLVRELLSWVKDRGTPKELRQEALGIMQSLAATGIGLPAYHEELVSTLKSLTADPDPTFRMAGFSILAARGDDYARRLLVAGLRAPQQAPFPPETIVGLLGLNPHGDFLPLLHDLMKSPPNEATRLECVRVLGIYAPARKDLESYYRSKEATPALRQAAAGSLLAADPDQFHVAAAPVIADESTPEALRVFSIAAEMRLREARLSRRKSMAADDFDRSVKKLAADSSSPAVKAAAARYLDRVDPQY